MPRSDDPNVRITPTRKDNDFSSDQLIKWWEAEQNKSRAISESIGRSFNQRTPPPLELDDIADAIVDRVVDGVVERLTPQIEAIEEALRLLVED
jgi:hypothetical protein